MGVDGSDPAQRAARRAFALASRLGDSVTLLHVLPPPPVISEPAVVLNVADLEKHVYEAGKLVVEKLASWAARSSMSTAPAARRASALRALMA